MIFFLILWGGVIGLYSMRYIEQIHSESLNLPISSCVVNRIRQGVIVTVPVCDDDVRYALFFTK